MSADKFLVTVAGGWLLGERRLVREFPDAQQFSARASAMNAAETRPAMRGQVFEVVTVAEYDSGKGLQ